MQRHYCGGSLEATVLHVHVSVGDWQFTLPVEGMRCDRCKEEVLSRDTVVHLEQMSRQLNELIKGSNILSERLEATVSSEADTSDYTEEVRVPSRSSEKGSMVSRSTREFALAL